MSTKEKNEMKDHTINDLKKSVHKYLEPKRLELGYLAQERANNKYPKYLHIKKDV